MPKNLIITVLIAVILGGGGFFAGMKYQQSKPPTFSRQFGSGQFGNSQRPNGARMGGGQVVGEIITQDDKSITVKLTDNSSKIILLSDTTAINKATEGTKSDLKIGERVAIFGTSNTDGSVTAQNIQLNPSFRGTQATPSP